MKKYKSFREFLKEKPRHRGAIAIVLAMVTGGIIVCIQTRESFDPGFFAGTVIFLILLALLQVYRSYRTYKRNS